MSNHRTHSALGENGPSLQELIDAYGDDWMVRGDTRPSATRRRQVPLDVLGKTDLAMTVYATNLTDLAVQLEEQTRLATEHLGEA
ncbi:hypothetical protein ACQP1K_29105 (plasmid) [Sphaerimonospora sp. CA-214678]|uniref:hypothetical protein n=1 Tax=Sphaerimonospora sp. CA-214678 TaxID=3240029 RepID=UPI003D8D9B8D